MVGNAAPPRINRLRDVTIDEDTLAPGDALVWDGTEWVNDTVAGGPGIGDALKADNLDQFAGVTQTAGKTLAITENTTLAGGTHSGTNTGDQSSVTGNAGTATALQTARSINGTSFNGTADITVAAAAGTLTGATLAAGVTASSLTSVGAGIALGTPASLVGTNITGTAAGLTAGTASAVAVGGITGLGTGVATALAINTGSAGAPVLYNGAGGTPSALDLTNGTSLPASGIGSGTIAQARLGTGSGGAGLKALFDDQTYKTIAGGGDALKADSLDQFADVTQTSGKTLAITDNTTLAGGTHSGTNTGDQTSVSGNAGTATALQNARTIGGVSFDGTGNIVPQTIQSVNEASDTTCFPLFISASGSQSLQPLNNTALTFNASNGTLSATTFSGSGALLSSIPESGVTNLTTDLAAKAPTASPTFTGTVTLPSTTVDAPDLTAVPTQYGGWKEYFVTGSPVTRTQQTLADITGLVTGTLSNSTLYEFEARLLVASTSAAGNQYAVHGGGTGSAATVFALGQGTSSSTATNQWGLIAVDTAGTATMTSNQSGAVFIHGFFTSMSTGTATMSIQHLKATSGTATCSVGSVLRIRKAHP